MALDIYCAASGNIHTLPTDGFGISWGVGGFVTPNNLKICMKLNWNFQRGWVCRRNPFLGGGIDISWNYTLYQPFIRYEHAFLSKYLFVQILVLLSSTFKEDFENKHSNSISMFIQYALQLGVSWFQAIHTKGKRIFFCFYNITFRRSPSYLYLRCGCPQHII